jgi:guanylate kinase
VSAKKLPLLIVLSGPSGVGKDAILSLMKKRFPSFYYPVTMTTRPKREKEIDGQDYFFVSPEKFMEMVHKGELLEWSRVYGNLYGVPINQIREALKKKRDIILKVDVQGAQKIKEEIPGAVLVFIASPSQKTLISRLSKRRTEPPENLKLRLQTAEEEIRYLTIFDYIVVNDEGQIEQTLKRIEAIITAEKCRIHPIPAKI